ncbi:MAG: ribosome-associated translation inhibitor RaiA [Chloroflexota bacterium]
MELQIAGTNIELTPTVRRYVERKLGKLDKHLPGIIETRAEISEEQTRSPQQRYLVRVTVNSGVGGTAVHGEERGEDLFKAVDRVAAIMVRQLDDRKGKLYEKRRGTSLARGEFNSEVEPPEPVRRVVKTKRFAIKPMSLEEATEQMEVLGHSFFLFFDADAGQVKLLYRRNDGNYGLIEPEFS